MWWKETRKGLSKEVLGPRPALREVEKLATKGTGSGESEEHSRHRKGQKTQRTHWRLPGVVHWE